MTEFIEKQLIYHKYQSGQKKKSLNNYTFNETI